MRTRKIVWPSLILAVGVVLAGCSSTSTPAGSTVTNPEAAKPAGSWLYPNGDLENTRDAAGATISSANVAGLQQAWTFKLPSSLVTSGPGFGSLAATPIVANGVVYLQDLGDNVYALALATGKLKWEYQVSSKIVEGGPNGVAVAGGVVYGDTMNTVFALERRHRQDYLGRPGSAQRRPGHARHPAAGRERPRLPGQLHRNRAHRRDLAGPERLHRQADLEIQHDRPRQQWRSAHPYGSGGAWETPLVGSDGSVTFGTGNPYQSAAEAIAHPSAWLYTDSEVNLDAATGKLRWYYQGVSNDFMDHDMQTSPIAATINGEPAVIGSGKMGVVYAMNASTGKLIWKTPVGEHSESDNYSLEAMEHKLTLTAPYTILPGSLGGVLSNLALAGNTVYVATVDQRFTLAKMSYPLGAQDGNGSGEIEALNLTTGKVEWDTKVPAMPLGAATVSNDLVFTTLYTGVLIALDRTTGAIVYQRKLPTSANAPS